MVNQGKRLVVISAIALAVGGVAWWRLMPRNHQASAAMEALAAQESTGRYSSEDNPVSPLSASIEQAIKDGRHSLGDLTRGDIEGVAEQVGELGDLYRSGTLDEFLGWMAARGHEPYMALWSKVDDPQKEWERLTATVRGAPFNPDAIRIRLRAHNGKVTPPPDGSAVLRSRGALNPELDPLRERVTAVEVTIPMRMTNTAGGTFDGILGIMLVRRPADGAWVPYQTAIYGVPQSTPLPILPL